MPPRIPRGLGLSELAYKFIGGLKANAKAYIAVTAPTVNSYKRLVVGAPTSGATWAPAYISYGYNNRTQMLRIPDAGRIEDRTVDGSCNPYLAATAMLAAGLDGIDRGLDAGEPNSANLYTLSPSERAAAGIELLPANLLDATRELERNEALRGALGKTRDGDYVDYFIEGQAARGAGRARADHAVGARPLPAAVLEIAAIRRRPRAGRAPARRRRGSRCPCSSATRPNQERHPRRNVVDVAHPTQRDPAGQVRVGRREVVAVGRVDRRVDRPGATS